MQKLTIEIEEHGGANLGITLTAEPPINMLDGHEAGAAESLMADILKTIQESTEVIG